MSQHAVMPLTDWQNILDKVREKTGKTDLLTAKDVPAELDKIKVGGGTPSVTYISNGVNFYDYDGTLLHSYTVEEAQALTELPELPEREGLICQGWNWTLEDIKAHKRALDVGATYITDDGNTHIYIRLEEGRTSPMLGVCPNGTVTVDWGDGTTDTLTGTSTSDVQWTDTHNYATAGEYVITLEVNGEMKFYGSSLGPEGAGILRYSKSSDERNRVYQTSVQKIQLGNGLTSIGKYAFYGCYSLTGISLPDGMTSIGERVFQNCYSLTSISLPNSVTSIGNYAFGGCYSLTGISLPDGVTSISERAFNNCYSLTSISLPNSVTSIGNYAFYGCCSLTGISLPDGVTSIGNSAFSNCYGAFYYDFSNHTTVPALSNTNAFSGISADCEIRVPSALYDEWITATNWSNYADQIVAV